MGRDEASGNDPNVKRVPKRGENERKVPTYNLLSILTLQFEHTLMIEQ